MKRYATSRNQHAVPAKVCSPNTFSSDQNEHKNGLRKKPLSQRHLASCRARIRSQRGYAPGFTPRKKGSHLLPIALATNKLEERRHSCLDSLDNMGFELLERVLYCQQVMAIVVFFKYLLMKAMLWFRVSTVSGRGVLIATKHRQTLL